MKFKINITKTNQSNLSNVDFDAIPFGRTFSDHMFVADYRDGKWTNPRIVPFGHFQVHPATLALHYGQSIFEGMKASVDKNGQPMLLRPEMHARRLNASAARMCMPDFPEDLFVEALHALVDIDRNWIPPKDGSALYIRPMMFADGEFIGVQASDSYKMLIFTGPVGPYYPKPVRLIVEEKYVRAAVGGVGEAKTAGNYAASLLPAQLAKKKGYDQVVWMDAKEFKYIQEVGTMNLFFVIDGKVVTPATDGAILKGITRDMIMTILRDKGYTVEERPISIDEVVEAYHKGLLQEAFGAGTAAVVAQVSDITYRDLQMDLPAPKDQKISLLAKSIINGLRSGEIEDTYGWTIPVKGAVAARAKTSA
ncbi:MAG: branched-chain amino acid aminotransferase [Bacteroidota bacterium]